MSVLVSRDTRVLTQGITGATGQLHTRLCREYGSQMVAGVTPGRGGTDFEGIPIFGTVKDAKAKAPPLKTVAKPSKDAKPAKDAKPVKDAKPPKGKAEKDPKAKDAKKEGARAAAKGAAPAAPPKKKRSKSMAW